MHPTWSEFEELAPELALLGRDQLEHPRPALLGTTYGSMFASQKLQPGMQSG